MIVWQWTDDNDNPYKLNYDWAEEIFKYVSVADRINGIHFMYWIVVMISVAVIVGLVVYLINDGRCAFSGWSIRKSIMLYLSVFILLASVFYLNSIVLGSLPMIKLFSSLDFVDWSFGNNSIVAGELRSKLATKGVYRVLNYIDSLNGIEVLLIVAVLSSLVMAISYAESSSADRDKISLIQRDYNTLYYYTEDILLNARFVSGLLAVVVLILVMVIYLCNNDNKNRKNKDTAKYKLIWICLALIIMSLFVLNINQVMQLILTYIPFSVLPLSNLDYNYICAVGLFLGGEPNNNEFGRRAKRIAERLESKKEKLKKIYDKVNSLETELTVKLSNTSKDGSINQLSKVRKLTNLSNRINVLQATSAKISDKLIAINNILIGMLDLNPSSPVSSIYSLMDQYKNNVRDKRGRYTLAQRFSKDPQFDILRSLFVQFTIDNKIYPLSNDVMLEKLVKHKYFKSWYRNARHWIKKNGSELINKEGWKIGVSLPKVSSYITTEQMISNFKAFYTSSSSVSDVALINDNLFKQYVKMFNERAALIPSADFKLDDYNLGRPDDKEIEEFSAKYDAYDFTENYIIECPFELFSDYNNVQIPKWFCDNMYSLFHYYNSSDIEENRIRYHCVINSILLRIIEEINNLSEMYEYKSVQFPKVITESLKTPISKVVLNRDWIRFRKFKKTFGKKFQSLKVLLIYDIITFVIYSVTKELSNDLYESKPLTNKQVKRLIVLFLLLILNVPVINNQDIVDQYQKSIGFLFKFAHEVYNKDWAELIKGRSESYVSQLKERKKALTELMAGEPLGEFIKPVSFPQISISSAYQSLVDILIRNNFNVIRLLSTTQDNVNQLKDMLISGTGLTEHDKFWNQLLDFDLFKEGQSVPNLFPSKLRLSVGSEFNHSSVDWKGLNAQPIRCKLINPLKISFNSWIYKRKPAVVVPVNSAYDYKGLFEIRTYYYLIRFASLKKEYYLNPYIDFRGRLYYDSILSPTHNKYMRDHLALASPLYKDCWVDMRGINMAEFDVSSSMLSIIFSLFGYKALVSRILSGQIDMHLLFLHFILKNMPDDHPWKPLLRRSDYKVLASPLIYGSTMKSSLRVHTETMFLKNPKLPNINEEQLKQFLNAVDLAFKQLFNRDHFIDVLFSVLSGIDKHASAKEKKLLKASFTGLSWKWFEGRTINYLITKASKQISKLGKYTYYFYTDTKQPDLGRMRRGLLANFIHSFDSLILWKIMSQKDNTSLDSDAPFSWLHHLIYTVHDSFFLPHEYVMDFIALYHRHLDSLFNYGPIANISKKDKNIIIPMTEFDILEYWDNHKSSIKAHESSPVPNLPSKQSTPIINSPTTVTSPASVSSDSSVKSSNNIDPIYTESLSPGTVPSKIEYPSPSDTFPDVSPSVIDPSINISLSEIDERISLPELSSIHIDNKPIIYNNIPDSEIPVSIPELIDNKSADTEVTDNIPFVADSKIDSERARDQPEITIPPVSNNLAELSNRVNISSYNSLKYSLKLSSKDHKESDDALTSLLKFEAEREQRAEQIVKDLSLNISKDALERAVQSAVAHTLAPITKEFEEKVSTTISQTLYNDSDKTLSFQSVNDPLFPDEEFDLKENEKIVHMRKVVAYLNESHSEPYYKLDIESIFSGLIDYEFMSSIGISSIDIKNALKTSSIESSYYTDFITHISSIVRNLSTVCANNKSLLKTYTLSGITKLVFDITRSVLKSYLTSLNVIIDNKAVVWLTKKVSKLYHEFSFNFIKHPYEYLTIKGNKITVAYDTDKISVDDIIHHLYSIRFDSPLNYMSMGYWGYDNKMKHLKTQLLTYRYSSLNHITELDTN